MRLLFLVILIVFICSLHSKPSASQEYYDFTLDTVFIVHPKKIRYTTKEYIKTFLPIAIEMQTRDNIPVSISLGQAILESDSGNSILARTKNNHFGIRDSKYRSYSTSIACWEDYNQILNRRYKQLKGHDYVHWAYGLKRLGYAEAENYPEILINLIKKHKLYKHDNIRAVH